jgi:DNA anti-recombination protein RmuC
MCDERQDTSPEMDLQQAILEELQNLVSEVRKVNERIDHLEERVEQVVTDLNTVHTLQRTYTGRLAAIEQMCVDQPLVTAAPTPAPKKVSRPPDGDGRVDP